MSSATLMFWPTYEQCTTCAMSQHTAQWAGLVTPPHSEMSLQVSTICLTRLSSFYYCCWLPSLLCPPTPHCTKRPSPVQPSTLKYPSPVQPSTLKYPSTTACQDFHRLVSLPNSQ